MKNFRKSTQCRKKYGQCHNVTSMISICVITLFAATATAFTIGSTSVSSTIRSTITPSIRGNSDTHRKVGIATTTSYIRLSHQILSKSSLSSSLSVDDVCTVQILMSDTGGGHRASANALRDAFNELHPGKIEVDIVDIFTDYGPFFPINAFVPIYKIMAEYSFLWKYTYEFGASPFGLWFNELVLETFCFESFKDCVSRPSKSTNKRADMVVSVHPLTQDIPLKILNYLDTEGKSRTGGRTTPFSTVVTDLGGAHPTWFNPGVDKCFVPSDALYKCARDRNVAPEQIVQYGLPIRKGFWADRSGNSSNAASNESKPWFGLFGGQKNKSESGDSITDKSKNNLREELGLVSEIPTVLVVGGGDGMGGIIQQARAMGEKLKVNADAVADKGGEAAYQMVVVCGNNASAQKELSAVQWGEGVSVSVQGFVNNMDEWMRASDVLVTKAGPGTIAEASICGLPCMLSSYLPGQEEGNVPYVEDAGFGTYSGDPVKIADTVSTWLSEPKMLSDMREAALEAARPSATIDIARDLAEMLFEHKKKVGLDLKKAEVVMQ